MSELPQVPLLSADMVSLLRARMPEVAEQIIAAVVNEVPSYNGAFEGPMGQTIATAVALAMDGFLSRVGVLDNEGHLRDDVRDGAYSLGRGEAQSGRTSDALLAAYRVGARVAWQQMARDVVAAGLDAGSLATFAELVFAYIDELSAYSVAGHNDQTAQADRDRQRLRERLARLLIAGGHPDTVHVVARRAGWELPETVTPVLVPTPRVRPMLTALGPLEGRALRIAGDALGWDEDDLVVVLVPEALRSTLRRALPEGAVLGPTRDWQSTGEAVTVALRARRLGAGTPGVIDTDEYLVPLVLGADEAAYAGLRARALAPLDDLPPATREKLEATLRAWLLCQGRRDDVAARLFVHPQTVRYRMGQLRELFGERLGDPEVVLELVLALGHPGAVTDRS